MRRRFETAEESFAHRTEWRGDCLIWTGTRNEKGYGIIYVHSRHVRAHRYSWERTNGPIPDGMQVDHANHCDRACVNPEHLRLATGSQNQQNRSGANSNSRTGVRNVYATGDKYYAEIYREGTRHRLGVFESLDEAAEAVARKRSELFGAFAGGV